MNLRQMYCTSTSVKRKEVTATKEITTYTYKTAVVTPAGTFSESEWVDLIEKQARSKFETNIIKKLTEYCLNGLAWITTEADAYRYALNLYSNMIWENKLWVGYEEFNTMLKENEVVEQISLI